MPVRKKSTPRKNDLDFEIEKALAAITDDSISGRAGRQANRYTDPCEAASQMIVEKMEIFFDRLEKSALAGNTDESLALCLAIIKGLYALAHSDDILEFEDDVLECCMEDASHARNLYLGAGDPDAGRNFQNHCGRAIPQDFVTKCAPEWIRLNG